MWLIIRLRNIGSLVFIWMVSNICLGLWGSLSVLQLPLPHVIYSTCRLLIFLPLSLWMILGRYICVEKIDYLTPTIKSNIGSRRHSFGHLTKIGASNLSILVTYHYLKVKPTYLVDAIFVQIRNITCHPAYECLLLESTRQNILLIVQNSYQIPHAEIIFIYEKKIENIFCTHFVDIHQRHSL